MCAVVLLGDPFAQDVFQVMFFQRLLELLLARRVNALSDDL